MVKKQGLFIYFLGESCFFVSGNISLGIKKVKKKIQILDIYR